jgi:hypothetical protein
VIVSRCPVIRREVERLFACELDHRDWVVCGVHCTCCTGIFAPNGQQNPACATSSCGTACSVVPIAAVVMFLFATGTVCTRDIWRIVLISTADPACVCEVRWVCLSPAPSLPCVTVVLPVQVPVFPSVLLCVVLPHGAVHLGQRRLFPPCSPVVHWSSCHGPGGSCSWGGGDPTDDPVSRRPTSQLERRPNRHWEPPADATWSPVTLRVCRPGLQWHYCIRFKKRLCFLSFLCFHASTCQSTKVFRRQIKALL